MVNFKTIAITSNTNKKNVLDIAKQCCEVLYGKSQAILVTENLSAISKSKKIKVSSNKQIIDKADLLICIGGDGTMLGSAREFGFYGVPMLGINLGNVGFLTDIALETITSSISEVMKGKFLKDRRSFLEASIGKKKSYIALNEVVIHSGALAQLIEYELFVNDIFVYRQRADGIIVSSPTGSTAYSLSGGGPILHPEVKAITLLPMFPHSLSSSPLLVNDVSKIKIKIIDGAGRPKLSLDSHDSLILKKGDEVAIKKAKAELTLLHPLNHDFYSACRNKLGWSSALSNN